MSIEHFFGTLKGQFRRFKLQLDMQLIEDAPMLAVAACILHNLAILHHDDVYDWLDCDDDDDDDYQNGNVPNIFPVHHTAEGK